MTHGVSSKGPWVLSASQAVHEADQRCTSVPAVDYLTESELVSLSDLWNRLAPWKRTAWC